MQTGKGATLRPFSCKKTSLPPPRLTRLATINVPGGRATLELQGWVPTPPNPAWYSPRLLSTSGSVLSSKPPGLSAPLGPLALAAADWRERAQQTRVGVRGTPAGDPAWQSEKGKAVQATPGSVPWSNHPSAGHHAAPCSSTQSAARGTQPSPLALIGCGQVQDGVSVQPCPWTSLIPHPHVPGGTKGHQRWHTTGLQQGACIVQTVRHDLMDGVEHGHHSVLLQAGPGSCWSLRIAHIPHELCHCIAP